MTRKPDPDQLHLGAALRDNAIDAVERENDRFVDLAYRAAVATAKRLQSFTTDDVWEALDGWGVAAIEPRAMGAVMRRLKREGKVKPLQLWQLSKRPECHRRPLRVWHSFLTE
jgi:hypothetical protein